MVKNMHIKEEYKVCDRCREKVNEHWYKSLRITKFKKRWVFGGFVAESEMDLCGKCNEKFERFMKMKLDDNEPTEYERYYDKK